MECATAFRLSTAETHRIRHIQSTRRLSHTAPHILLPINLTLIIYNIIQYTNLRNNRPTLVNAPGLTQRHCEFAYVVKAKPVDLDKPFQLQLGCKGSKSKVHQGTEVNLSVDTLNVNWYFDIANIDRYDIILGTPFLTTYGGVLDFKERCIRLGDLTIACMESDVDAHLPSQSPTKPKVASSAKKDKAKKLPEREK